MATFKEIETEDGADAHATEEETLPAGVWKTAVAAIGMLLAVAVPYALRADVCVELPKSHTNQDELAQAAAGSGQDGGADGEQAAASERTQLCVADIRPWTPGDVTPFAKLFRVSPDKQLTKAEESMLAETSGLADDSAEATDVPTIAVAPMTPVAPAPAATPKTAQDTGLAPEPADPTSPEPAPVKPANPYKQIRIPTKLYKGYTQRIEDPHGALRHFFQKLAKVAVQDKGAVARISHWGDSTIAADGMTSMARRLFQTTFGDAGRGFVAVETGSDWYRVKDVLYSRKGWRAKKIIGGKAKDGRYGLGGNAAVGWKGAFADYKTVAKGPVGRKVSRLRVFYREGPKSGAFSVSVDGADPVLQATEAPAFGDATMAVDVDDGAHAFRVRATGGGPVRLYGVSLERDRNGVIYDMLGVVGARASRMLNYDAEHLAEQIRVSGTDLVLLHFGGNSLTSNGMSMRWYRERYEKVIALYRAAAPNVSCLVMTPIDHGERYRGRVRTRPDLLKRVEVQRDVALKAGCAFFSIFEAMGGAGTMGRWYKERPPLVSGDYAHATKHGARVLGLHLFRSMMASFKDYLAALED